jgi:hypothetical protein
MQSVDVEERDLIDQVDLFYQRPDLPVNNHIEELKEDIPDDNLAEKSNNLKLTAIQVLE